MNTNYQASFYPHAAIENISYEGQPAQNKMYLSGFENYFESLPILNPEDENLSEKIHITQGVMKDLSSRLKENLHSFELPQEGEFKRTIIALEEPKGECIMGAKVFTPGSQLLVAQWGKGFTSPIHGHNRGYMHEEMLTGKIRVNTYRITDFESKTVRLVETTIKEEGVFVSEWSAPSKQDMYEQQALVHNFVAVEPSLSLHYLPTSTKDGRGNTYTLEEFGSIWRENVSRIDSKEGLYLQPGDVVLVRSTNVPEYGDHFIVITGHPVMKTHGFRPQERSIAASANHSKLLDFYPQRMGLTLLKLDEATTKAFHAFHGIIVNGKEVTFPEA